MPEMLNMPVLACCHSNTVLKMAMLMLTLLVMLMHLMTMTVLLTMMVLTICSTQAGAHFVIPTTVDLPPVIAEINRRLAMGIKP